MYSNTIMVVCASLIAVVMFRPKLFRSPLWRATVTPLASIIGSGFLVAGPILSHVAGNWAWVAMAGLCGAAYVFGAAIRYNIAHVEPRAGNLPRDIALLERASYYALAFAYFLSVCYYLNLFASFALKADGIVDPQLTRWISTVTIASLGLLGTFRGLRAMEHIEVAAVGMKLALIGGLLTALVFSDIIAASSGSFSLPAFPYQSGFKEFGIILGLVILVQGFETSRYLGEAYDGPMRIKTMRYAQLIATAIYVAFIFFATPYFPQSLPPVGGETQIIDMLAPLGNAVGPLIIFAALASQLSAAVADMNGAGGLLEDASRRRIPVKIGYFATACVAVLITWIANIFEIIVYASKAFVIYYGIQSITALLVAVRQDLPKKKIEISIFAGGALLALLVLLFGMPVEAGDILGNVFQ